MNESEELVNMAQMHQKAADSKKEFNDRLSNGDIFYNMQQQALELENRILQAEAKIASLDLRVAERCKYIEDVIGLYKENIGIFDREIEKARSLKFKLVALEGNETYDD